MDFLAFLSGLPLTFSQECLFFNLQLWEVYFEMGFMQQNIIGSEVAGTLWIWNGLPRGGITRFICRRKMMGNMKGERFQVSSNRKRKSPFIREHTWCSASTMNVFLWGFGKAVQSASPCWGISIASPWKRSTLRPSLTSSGPQRLEWHGHVVLPFLLFFWRRLIEELDSLNCSLCFRNLCSFCVFACFIFFKQKMLGYLMNLR